MSRLFLLCAAVSGFFSVGLGAFGAHGLKNRLDAYSLGVYQTGVQYQFFHAIALLALSVWVSQRDLPLFRAAGYAFVIGTVIFSGSLYALALTQVKSWGAVTPLGGLSFLIGWLCLIVAAARLA